MKVSVIIPARDERERWPQVLRNLAAQTRQPDEVVVADGLSTDGSRELLDQVAAADPTLLVVDNPDRVVPAALNRALAAATGDVVARMDTHADYPPDYLQRVVAVLEDRPDVDAVGGAMATAGRGPWGRAIASVLSRRVGLGGARHRVGQDAGPIQHVFSGCYRREAIAGVGGWDERLLANEDFEADVRIGEQGGTLWLEPAARSTWYVRERPGALARQMWRYGYHKALTVHLHPSSLTARQLAPPALVAGLVGLTVARPRWAGLLGGAYLVSAGALGAAAGRSDGSSSWRAALTPPLVHLSWGAGALAGLVRFVGARRGEK